MQYAPEELLDFDAFLKEWIFYLQTIEEPAADDYLEEALEMQTDPISALETARQSVQTHPELYLKVLSMQYNDKSRLEIGLEALKSIDQNYIIRSEIALQTAEVAIRLNDPECAIRCRTEAFRSNSTAVNFLRALVNHPDYTNALAELTFIASEYRAQQQKSFHKQNRLGDDTGRFIRFLNCSVRYWKRTGKYHLKMIICWNGKKNITDVQRIIGNCGLVEWLTEKDSNRSISGNTLKILFVKAILGINTPGRESAVSPLCKTATRVCFN